MLSAMQEPVADNLTYYSADLVREAAAPALLGVTSADVGIVGGGLAGLSAALCLAEGGYRVVLLEAGRLGAGASGRSGGQVLPGFSCSQHRLTKLLSVADARLLWDLSVEGVRLLKRRIQLHHIDCDWQAGHLHVATKTRQLRELRDWQIELNHACNYLHTQLLEKSATQALLGSARYLGALYDPDAGHLHPLRYLLGLASAARHAGVIVHEHSRVTGFQAGGPRALHVQSAQGELHCDHLLLAGNATLGSVAPSLERRILPVGTYMLATEPLGAARARSLIANNASVSDMNWILDYFRRSADDRLLFGGRVSYGGLDEQTSLPATRERMLRVFPQLVGARIDHHWGGWLDITMNRAPDFGRLAPNVWYLQGFSGHGLALTGLAGQLVAEAIAGTAERFDVFARIPHRDFPGGALLRRPLLRLAMLWYRLRDL
jgi:gamma-glutamylputrescine oxidase